MSRSDPAALDAAPRLHRRTEPAVPLPRLGVKLPAGAFEHEDPLLATIGHLHDAGCALVQVRLDILLSHPDLRPVTRLLGALGMPVIVHLGGTDDLIFIEQLERRFAGLRVEAFVLHPPWDDQHELGAVAATAARLRSLGKDLLIENDRSEHLAREYLALLDATGCDLCLDLGHDAACGTGRAGDARLLERTGMLHLHRYDPASGRDHLQPDAPLYSFTRRILARRPVPAVLEVKAPIETLPAIAAEARRHLILSEPFS